MTAGSVRNSITCCWKVVILLDLAARCRFGNRFVDPHSAMSGLRKMENMGATCLGVIAENGGWELYRRDSDGMQIPLYRFSDVPRELWEYEEMCVYHQTSADSSFTRRRICTRAMPERTHYPGRHASYRNGEWKPEGNYPLQRAGTKNLPARAVWGGAGAEYRLAKVDGVSSTGYRPHSGALASAAPYDDLRVLLPTIKCTGPSSFGYGTNFNVVLIATVIVGCGIACGWVSLPAI